MKTTLLVTLLCGLFTAGAVSAATTAAAPEKTLTRAMLVTVLWRMAGSPAAAGNGGFTDLRAEWYRAAAVWGQQNEIVTGTSRMTFAPDKTVTKEQAAVLFARFAKTMGAAEQGDEKPVYVAECSAWAQSGVQEAFRYGVCDSYVCLGAPKEAASRAELAHMLRLLSNCIQKA